MDTTLVAIDDLQLEVRRHGSGDRLVLLHGEDGLMFATPFIEALAERFEVVAPSMPGFGQSSRPSFVKSVRDLALVTAEFLDTLGEPVPVVGLSFGAWVGLDLALVARSNVSQLVLISPVGIKVGDREDRDFADLWMADFDGLKSILYSSSLSAPDLNQLSDEDLVYLATCQESVARYGWQPYMHDPALRHWARRVQCPTLVVSGGADSFALLPHYYERFAQLIGSGALHRTIDAAGHRIEEEAPKELAGLVEDFLIADRSPSSAPTARRG